MLNANPYNVGHSKEVFATRVRVLSMHPELWTQIPDGCTVNDYRTNMAIRQLWNEAVQFLKEFGVVRPSTTPIDVNIPKLIRAVRTLAR